jgi:hypothetical protein
MAELKAVKVSRDLQKVLYPQTGFVVKAQRDDNTGNAKTIKYNYANKIGKAHIGDNPSLPLTVKQHANGFSEYDTNEVYTDPYLIEREDEMLLYYDKYKNMLSQLSSTIQEVIDDTAANEWGATDAARIIDTSGLDKTGGTARKRSATLVNATGDRLRIGKLDLINVKQRFQKDGYSDQTIWGVVTPDQYDDLLLIPDFIDYEKTGQRNKLAKGVVGRIMNIEFIVRWNDSLGSIGLHYSATKTKKDNYKTDGTANTTTTDRAAALFFAKEGVRYSDAPVETAINRKAAGYKGATILESFTRFGATISRQHDEKGVVVLCEKTPA